MGVSAGLPAAPVTLSLQKDLERHLALGHPWVYRSALRLPAKLPGAGEVVDLVDRHGRSSARGERQERDGRSGGGEAISGGEPDGTVEIHEGPARYQVDVVHGQKTGFFLDQRDNRRVVGQLASGATVLNLFGYTGGFSVAA